VFGLRVGRGRPPKQEALAQAHTKALQRLCLRFGLDRLTEEIATCRRREMNEARDEGLADWSSVFPQTRFISSSTLSIP
jgi:hypothetical protein